MGGVDIMVKNEGIKSDGILVRMREEDWDEVMKVNMKQVLNIKREMKNKMMRRRKGRIIKIK